ncbi:NAD(P)/FAD-dependent oxidoreductase [Xanthobacter agilis]|uniref:NADPH-dependent 2,4-dienoyl-CoA reductase/sulfur reductase-like enzyme n=1 Tax=Xanthobacter agilis TaxID=47492 RepID=A0ABU0LI12_XANAG|nr:FAD-dependent oxidoreductase [Xanthobacter agilis]MDQ0506728.1 NADPH-dependent 2,4-dienoyl-CoA reductase/sulfur reductase-like enzyme [Xanthobacter agilis]
MAPRVVVVGASLGGLRAAEALTSLGLAPGQVTIVGAERHPPYNRPPLSKELLEDLGDIPDAFAKTAFRLKPEVAAAHWRLGTPAVAADLGTRLVHLSDGSTLPYDALMVATGLTPRRLPFPGGDRQRFVLRTLEDAAALRQALRPEHAVVVVGAGFIGCEAAATAAKLGCSVTVVEPQGAPMARAIGAEVGAALQRLHTARGVRFRTKVGVLELICDRSGTLKGVRLSDGTELEADVLVEAIGSSANVDWLRGQGLDLSNGLLCDNHMRVEGRGDLYGIGDVARFPNPLYDAEPRRVEHWCVPGQTARRAAETVVATLNGAPPPEAEFRPLPSFWSDQHGLRIQSFGLPAIADGIEVLEGALDTPQTIERGVAIGYRRAGRPVAVLAIALPPGRALRHRAFLDA